MFKKDKLKKILIIGGGGYIGTELANYLSKKKYKIICYDTFWFGNNLNKKNIKAIKGDVRTIKQNIFKDIDIVINLAYLSNDPLCELSPKDTWETGPLAIHFIMENCVKYKVKKFIFASSGSIYGLKKEKKVHENLGLDPITDYNKSKMVCENVVNSYKDKIKIIILRPATVCGYSKRLRLDVVLNLFCYQAYFKKKIIVTGGKQIRPLLDIRDMVRCYEFFIKCNFTGTFNVGFEQLSILEMAKSVSKYLNTKIVIKKSNDPRSYRMDSSKLLNLGFKPKYNHLESIMSLKKFFKVFKPSDKNWNLKWIIKNNFLEKKK